jgi:hypothetical protein
MVLRVPIYRKRFLVAGPIDPTWLKSPIELHPGFAPFNGRVAGMCVHPVLERIDSRGPWHHDHDAVK